MRKRSETDEWKKEFVRNEIENGSTPEEAKKIADQILENIKQEMEYTNQV